MPDGIRNDDHTSTPPNDSLGGGHAITGATTAPSTNPDGDIDLRARVGFMGTQNRQRVFGCAVRRRDTQRHIETESSRRLRNLLAMALVRFRAHQDDD
jgi:hypothetical protein